MTTERVTGIGGVFFKSQDPKALSAWYRDALGVELHPHGEFAIFKWNQDGDAPSSGLTVWALFPADTKHFAPSAAPFMINYRVANLDRMLDQLRAHGVEVDGKIQEDFNGRFAWVFDPEGNKIELWEPKEGF